MGKKAYIAIAAMLVIAGIVFLSSLKIQGDEQDENGTIKIGVAIYLGDDTFISHIMNSLRERAAQFERDTGVRVQLSIVDAQSSQTTQNSQIDRFISMDYDVLCVNLVDRTNASYVIEKAMAANIPVVFFNREPVQADMQKWDKLYYIGTDPAENGRMQGQIVVDAYNADPSSIDLNGNGIVEYVMLEGEVRHQDAVLRTENSVKAIRDAGIEVQKLDGAIADWERARAQYIAKRWLEDYPGQIELFICNNDDMALGVIDAVESLELDFTNIVGIDGTEPGREAIDQGKMLGSVVIDHAAHADLIFEAACALATGGLPEDSMDVQADRSIRADMYIIRRR